MNSVEHLQSVHRDMTLIHQNFLWQMGRNTITNELLVSYTSSVFTYMSSYEQLLQQVHQEILRKETVICELQCETRGLREKTLKLKKKVRRLRHQLNNFLREYVDRVDNDESD